MYHKYNNSTRLHLVRISPVNRSRFHIYVDSIFLFEIKINDFIYFNGNRISRRDKKFIIFYAILRSWGLTFPLSHSILYSSINNLLK